VALGVSEGAEFRQPMAIAVIGGLATSTLLTLFIVPVAYLILDDLKEKTVALLRWARRGRMRRSSAFARENTESTGR